MIGCFGIFFTADQEAQVAFSILMDLKVHSVGIPYVDDPYGNSVVQALEKKFAGRGIEIVKIPFDKNVNNFEPYFAEIHDLQAIFIAGFVKHVVMGIKQLRKMDYQGIIAAGSGGANPKTTKLSEAEGVYIGAPTVYNPNYPFAKEFQEKFEIAFKKPFSHQAANGYDFVKIFTGLIEGQEITRNNIKIIFEKGFMYSGVLGDQELKPGEQEIVFPLHTARIQDGKIIFVRD